MISIKGLHKYFNKGKSNEIHVINDVSLELPERGMVAIFGQSGCGKTTLLNVIGGLDSFADGELTIEGQSVSESPDEIRNKYIGYIFQNYNLNVSETCFENVANALHLCGLTDTAEIERRVIAALKNVGMEKYKSRTPDTLSGGQQQRIAIARAIVKAPRIILADEPTGNLDETNTVMIMDLLKAISRDHLVVLVTHEASLVDYYCDKVIELEDGAIKSIRDNDGADGYEARDKSTIYLGELEHTELSNESARLEFYGDAPEKPIRLKLVNNNGRLYLKVESDGIQLIDGQSEVRLKEGVYKPRSSDSEKTAKIDMSVLPTMSGHGYGKLFKLSSSIRSGYVANFVKQKKSKKLLQRCMALFAMVIVFMSAIFGTAIGDILEARRSYNHNVFYVYTPSGDVSDALYSAYEAGAHGIDYTRLTYSINTRLTFTLPHLETFSSPSYKTGLEAVADCIDEKLAESLELVVGESEPGADEMLITTRVADTLLKSSSFGHIKEYEDLLGLRSTSINNAGGPVRIVGIVRSGESAVYLNSETLAEHALATSDLLVHCSEKLTDGLAPGEVMLAVRYNDEQAQLPSLGDTISIHGIPFKVSGLLEYTHNYDAWLDKQGLKKELDPEKYLTDLVLSESPSVQQGSDEFNKLLSDAHNEHYFDALENYYSELDRFLEELWIFDDDFELWLATVMNIPEAKYTFADESYYPALKYRELKGRFPTVTELEAAIDSLPSLSDKLSELYYEYESIFYMSSGKDRVYIDSHMYFVSPEDHVRISERYGESHRSVMQGYTYVYDTSEKHDVMVYQPTVYTLIHSNNIRETEEYLLSNFSDIEPLFDGFDTIITPTVMFRMIISESLESIISSLIVMAVVAVLMSVCMYFIMRSSLMSRIKEVGIYRAIGVSRKNLTFRFAIESLVLSSLTVFTGFFLSCAFIFVCKALAPSISTVFFFPLWYALILFALIAVLVVICGTLPMLMLLRKTPAQILAKYDI